VKNLLLETYPHLSSDFLNPLREFFISAANQIGVPLEYIEKIIIADKVNFGAKIQEIQRDFYGELKGYTNNKLYIAAGKTLSRKVENKVVSTIVFQDFVFSPFIQEPTSKEQKEFFDACYYTTFHELGHCLDNYIRQDWQDNIFQAADNSIILPAYIYNIDILLSDFAACVHSSKWMSEDAASFEINSSRENLARIYEEVKGVRTKYINRKVTLYDVALHAAHFFWIILIQHIKLIGIIQGRGLFDIYVQNLCPNDKAEDVINNLQDTALMVWEDYPDWTEAHKKQFLNLWFSLAEKYGYFFSSEIGGDKLLFG
jgi:hypothetical protein